MDPRYRPVQTKSAGHRFINKVKCALPYVPCFICLVGIVQCTIESTTKFLTRSL
ncbi:hypothetical protein J6590_033282 [Homalodisca vitripennis]|nr:hypothetical protein J6590_033282 [Homalodisca vitripennis]